MGQNDFKDDVKSRIPAEMKRQLEVLARERQLAVSDIVRQALREFLRHHADEIPGQTELLLDRSNSRSI